MCRQQKEAENREEGKFGTEEKPKEKNEKAKAKKKKRRADRRLCYAGQSKAPLELHKGPYQFSECIFFFFFDFAKSSQREKKKKRANGQKNCRVQRHNALPEVKQTKDLCEGAQ